MSEQPKMQLNIVWDIPMPEEMDQISPTGQAAVPVMLEAFEKQMGQPFVVHSIVIDVDARKAFPIRVSVRGHLEAQA